MIYPIKYLKIILLALVCISLFTTCKKYPEDGHTSLQTVKHRLTQHDWFFNKLLIDDRDSTLSHLNHFTTSFSTDPSVLKINIRKFQNGTNGSTLYLYTPIFTERDIGFSLRKRKKDVGVITGLNPNGTVTNFFIEDDIEWAIRKLTSTEFIIEKEFNGLKYRIEFKS